MARKPTTSTTLIEGTTLPVERIITQQNAAAMLHDQQQAQVRAVATQIGYQLPADCTDPDLIMRDIAANMRRSVEACLEVGRGLRVLKEACEHGEFINRLDSLGIETRVAQKFMASAAKFSNAASTPLLKVAGNQTKLFEMLVLDDEQIEELELTGSTGELKLDDIATMSVKELRATLREVREKNEAQSRVMADKNSKIDELAAKLVTKQNRVEVPAPDTQGAVIRSEVSAFAFEAEAVLRGKLDAAFEALSVHTIATGSSHDDFMAGVLCQIEMTIKQLRSKHFIKQAPDGEIVPEWLRDGAAQQAEQAMAEAMAQSGWARNEQGQMVPAGE